MLESYLTLDGTEFVNHTRLQSYIDNGLVPGYDHLEACGCESITPAVLDASYVSPSADPAPWYDVNIPESADFAGLLVLSVTGADDRPTARTLTQAVTGGGAFGRRRVEPRTIVVQGVLLGSSCCGVAYGLSWLGQALDGCGSPGCDGTDLVALSCCPPVPDVTGGWDSGLWDDGIWDDGIVLSSYLRTMRRVALLDGPNVTRRAGQGCAGGCSADVLFVELVLGAAEPWLWSAPTEVVDVSVPTDDGSDCVEWTLVETGCVGTGPCCGLAGCVHGSECGDPSCATASPPSISLGQTCYCTALATNTSCSQIDTAGMGAFTEALPTITVTAGSSDLRRFTVTIYEKGPGDADRECCEQVALDIDYDESTVTYDDADVSYDGVTASVAQVHRCDPHSVYHVGYLQAGATLVLDGQIRRATVDCDGESVPASDVWGADGAPLDFLALGCGKSYCVELAADALFPAASDATVTIDLSGRE